MTANLYSAAWDFGRMNFTGAGATFSGSLVGAVKMTSGLYMHGDIITVGGVQIDGQSLLPWRTDLMGMVVGPRSLTFNPTTCKYNLSSGGGNFAVDFTSNTWGLEIMDILGFQADLFGASSYVSTKRPKYMIISVLPNQTKVHDDYEPSGRTVSSESDNGQGYSVTPDQLPVYRDWTQPYENLNNPSDTAYSGNPLVGGAAIRRKNLILTKIQWTWEDFFQHCRGHLPFSLVDLTDGSGMISGQIYKLRSESAHFDPKRAIEDFDGYWNIDFKCRSIVWGDGV